MKKIALFVLCCCLYCLSHAQGSINSEVRVKELAVPKSPAFKLLDISPSQIETPTTPKQFVLGIAQSFNDSIGLPQNYSIEFAPYWWLKPSNRSVYELLGLKTTTNAAGKKTVIRENPFSGLKFTSISLALVRQDLIPDKTKQSQKIFSVGVHSTIVKVHSKNYGKSLESKLQQWHDAAEKELAFAMIGQPANPASPEFAAYWQKFTDMKPTATGEIFDDINDVMNEKPLFSLDIAAAYGSYGINDSVWRPGRTGVWSTISSYLPIKLDDDKINKNYFALFGYLRFLNDKYAPGKTNVPQESSCLDIGGKLELKFDKLSIGYEIIHRNYSKDGIDPEDRRVGVVSFQMGNNVYINGAFGKDFGITNKLISFLGIAWGFGTEKIKLE